MRKFGKNFISMVLSLALTVGILLGGAGSIKTSAICCRKDYFDKSKYTLTGDMAHDVAMIAKSQKGRTCNDFGYSGVDYGAWCDEFVADCLENAGADSSIVAHGSTVADFESQMRARGAVTVTSPKEGDLIFFTISHVEIVTKVVNGVVYSAGGNNGSYPGSCAGERSTSWGTARVYLRPNYPTKHKLTVNYYSNYADKSFDNPLNAVGSSKNVLVKSSAFYSNEAIPDGLHNYTNSGNSAYLGRTGYTATGNWNTKADGSGISVNQNTSFSNGQAMAKALGKDISSGNASINLYPEWIENTLTVNYYSNYADKSFDNPLNAVGSSKNVLVKTYVYDKDDYGGNAGLHNYKNPGNSAYLGRTGYTATGNWNTKADGSGISVNQDTAFSSLEALASALGKNVSTGSASVNLYPEWIKNTLTVNYYSNYADKSFDNPLNAVGSSKNVLVKTYVYDKDDYGGNAGLHNYKNPGNSAYLGRTGYIATGNWNTKADGSGISVNQDTAFSSLEALASALGKNVSTGSASVNLYPEWNANSLIVNYYSNYADKSFDDPLNAVSSDKSVLVKTTYFKYDVEHKYGLNDFSCEGDSAYLGRTGYTTTKNWNTKADGSGISINESTGFASGQALAQALGKDLSNGDVSINLYPEWIKEHDVQTEIIVKEDSGAYLDEDNGIIFGVEANLTEAQLLDRFVGVQGGNIEVSASSRRMGTGTVITLCDASGNEVSSYLLVVFGDIDGNGIINSSDVVAANEGLAYGFEQDCFKTAANVSMTRRNDRFNATDVAALLEMIQNTGVDQTEIADTLAYYSGLV